jgi:3-dehydroquinate synthase
LLNLGHTFGHAIEAGLGYGAWLHGEAVGAGMVLAAAASQALGWLSEQDVERVVRLIAAAGLPVQSPDFGIEEWMRHMGHDKKVESGVIRFVLLKQLGQAVIQAGLPTACWSSCSSPHINPALAGRVFEAPPRKPLRH